MKGYIIDQLKSLLPEVFNLGNEQGDWEPYFKALEEEKEKVKTETDGGSDVVHHEY